jgi:quercetin dioxygenase-like cupin family protein
MNPLNSSCEVSVRSAGTGGSRILRFQPAVAGSIDPHRWEGVPVAEYKHAAAHWCGVSRMALVGGGGEATRFHVRYFEIAPGGFTSLEKHRHEHAVVVLRGRGHVQLGDQVHRVGYGDTVYVAPWDAHQFRNASADEPFGFLCIVDAERDLPQLIE